LEYSISVIIVFKLIAGLKAMLGSSLLETQKNLDRAIISVLIIDDDENITRTFSRILQKNGYQTDSALTGEDAIRKAASKAYNVALIDVCLPDMNGIDLLHKLTDPEGKMVKIIITGFPTMANKSARPDAYFLKPVKPQELLALISQKTGQM
jgi:DNA-binding NtrC family response regulator